VDETINRYGLKAKPYRTIMDPEVFKSHLEKIRRLAYSIDDRKGEAGTRSLGGPTFDHAANAIASISFAPPTHRLSRERLQQLACMVLETAGKSSQSLGREFSSSETRGSYGTARSGTA
jgi:DNA-binding IclR family transcriptional regulator